MWVLAKALNLPSCVFVRNAISMPYLRFKGIMVMGVLYNLCKWVSEMKIAISLYQVLVLVE